MESTESKPRKGRSYFFVLTVQFRRESYGPMTVLTHRDTITVYPEDNALMLHDRITEKVTQLFNLPRGQFSELLYHCEPLELS